MAQYDVFANPSRKRSRRHSVCRGDPSALLDALATRLTMPLALANTATKVPTALSPVITGKGQRLHALAHYAAPCFQSYYGDPSTTWRRRAVP